MKKPVSMLLISCCLFALAACSQTTPQEYFAKAALSSNLLHGFAGPVMQRELASPSEMLIDAKTGATAPMKRAEVLKFKMDAIESSYAQVKSLKSNEDTKEMIAASVALFDFALPVYRNEYAELAALYDGGAAPDKIAALENAISEKYSAQFQTLHNAVVSAGKSYAAKHGIEVR